MPETSDASVLGLVFTPTFADLNIAVDYFEIEVNDQISELGAGTIIGNCYAGENFPNNFCNLVDRAGATATQPFAILEVRDSPVNIDTQSLRGLDLTTRYTREFNFGELLFESNMTWTFEDVLQLFGRDSNAPDAFSSNDNNGTIGDPSLTGNARLELTRGDWTYQWLTDYVGNTSNARFFATQPDDLITELEATFYHHASIRWEGDTWGITGGVRNLFDEQPPLVSSGVTTRRGNIALNATQYDLRGRRLFVQVSKTF